MAWRPACVFLLNMEGISGAACHTKYMTTVSSHLEHCTTIFSSASSLENLCCFVYLSGSKVILWILCLEFVTMWRYRYVTKTSQPHVITILVRDWLNAWLQGLGALLLTHTAGSDSTTSYKADVDHRARPFHTAPLGSLRHLLVEVSILCVSLF